MNWKPTIVIALLAGCAGPGTPAVEPQVSAAEEPSESASAPASEVGAAREPVGALQVLVSASSPFRLCVRTAQHLTSCFERVEGELRRIDLGTTGILARTAPFFTAVDGASLVVRVPTEDAPQIDPLPFEPVQVADLTLGVSCLRAVSGEVACDSWEGDGFRPLLLDGRPVNAVELRDSDASVLALDVDGRLMCSGRDCTLLADQRRALEAGEEWHRTGDEPEVGHGSGTPWPVAPELPAARIVAEGVARLRTDGLGMVCIEDRAHHVVCHGGAWSPIVALDTAGALDFATAANVFCLLMAPVETARLECTYRGRSERVTVLTADVSGATRLHAGGTTMCVEADGRLSCTELAGRSVAAPLTEVFDAHTAR